MSKKTKENKETIFTCFKKKIESLGYYIDEKANISSGMTGDVLIGCKKLNDNDNCDYAIKIIRSSLEDSLEDSPISNSSIQNKNEIDFSEDSSENSSISNSWNYGQSNRFSRK